MNCEIDISQMCSHLKKKLFEEDGAYHHIWLAIQDDPEVAYTLRNRQLLIYRNVNKVLCLSGKAAPKIFREKDPLVQML